MHPVTSILLGLMIGILLAVITEHYRHRGGIGGLVSKKAIDVNHEPPETIVCAAMMHRQSFHIVIGLRHFDLWMHSQLKDYAEHVYHDETQIRGADWEQGFLTSRGVFVDRYEALKIAEAAGQLNRYRPKTSPKNMLFSEDLY
jgi:hypothetical protein